MLRVVVFAALAATACARPVAAPRFPDPPLDLGDRDDRLAARDQLDALPPGPARTAARAALADALAGELDARLDDDQPAAAGVALAELAALWQDDPAAFALELAPRAAAVAAVRRARAAFARAGTMVPAILAIVMLAELEPAMRPEQLDDLDAALAFADELEVASVGPDATRAQPIALLAPSVLVLPLPWLVDRYVALVVDRQRAVDALVHAGTANVEIVRAHRDVTASAHRIAIALARGGRALEIHDHLKGATGIGTDPKLDATAEIAADQHTAGAFAELARALHADRDAPDDVAALAVCETALARFPADRELLALAGQLAAGAGRIAQAIALDRAAIHAAGDQLDPVLAAELVELYPRRLAALAAAGRFDAAEAIWRELAHAARARGAWTPVAAAAEAALGAGQLAAGDLDTADRTLHDALDRAPTVAADDALAALAAARGELPAARRAIGDALALLGESKRDGVRRAELEHRAADLARRAGDPHAAGDRYLDSLRSWTELGDSRELPPELAARRLLDSGETMWFLGDAPRATSLIVGAVDAAGTAPTTGDPRAATAVTAIVREAAAFLLAIGRAGDAVDVCHRALGMPALADRDAVDLALWVVGDARWRGAPADRVALDYLATRTGRRWPAQLAAAAAGRRTFASLDAAATTSARRDELRFATALFARDRAALATLIATDPARAGLIRHYLAAPTAGPPRPL